MSIYQFISRVNRLEREVAIAAETIKIAVRHGRE